MASAQLTTDGRVAVVIQVLPIAAQDTGQEPVPELELLDDEEEPALLLEDELDDELKLLDEDDEPQGQGGPGGAFGYPGGVSVGATGILAQQVSSVVQLSEASVFQYP